MSCLQNFPFGSIRPQEYVIQPGALDHPAPGFMQLVGCSIRIGMHQADGIVSLTNLQLYYYSAQFAIYFHIVYFLSQRA
jgi:hypothetical protein